MTDVNGLSRSNGVDPSVSVPLDGDTLMSYCAAQLNQLNGDIDSKLADQQKMRDYKARLNELKSEIGTGGAASKEQQKAILLNYAELLKETPPGPDRDNLQEGFQNYRKTVCYNGGDDAPKDLPNFDTYAEHKGAGAGQSIDPDIDPGRTNGTLSADQAKKMTDGLDGVSEDVGKNSELDMIALQDLVSKRQMAIQTTSQIMAKFAQGAETIANNIK